MVWGLWRPVSQFLAQLSVNSNLTQKERESTKKVACASLWVLQKLVSQAGKGGWWESGL